MIHARLETRRGVEGYTRWIRRREPVWMKEFMEPQGIYLLHIWHRESCRCNDNVDGQRGQACDCLWSVSDKPILADVLEKAEMPMLIVRHLGP